VTISKPDVRPARPFFSSGPCAKPPGWGPEHLALGSLGRSHRSRLGKARLGHAIELTRRVLRVPASHRIGIVPASDTGAVEMALWSLLGARPVTLLAWESFGEGWVTDVVKQLKLEATVIKADYGELPDLAAVDPASDVVFTWNGTTSGVKVPDGDWISDSREGLVIADATSAAFAQDLPWSKIDVATFSWQKVLGGEGGHGILVLGPRAVERLESYSPAWPLPKIFRLTKGGKLIEGIFHGETINTPSMLAVEDYIFALEWAIGVGGPHRPVAGQCRGGRRLGPADGLDRASRPAAGNPVQHQRLPQIRGRRRNRGAGGSGQEDGGADRGGRGGLRPRLLPRRAAGTEAVVRGDGRH
jgi:phosphoserine aminotransferase